MFGSCVVVGRVVENAEVVHFLHAGVVLVCGSSTDTECRVGLVVEDGGGFQGAVGIDCEELVVGRAVAVGEGKGEGGVGVGIGGVELAHDGPDGQVLRNGGVAQVYVAGRIVVGFFDYQV